MDADESLARAMEDGGKDDEIGDEINSQRLRRRSRRRDSTQCDDYDVRTDGGGGAGDGCRTSTDHLLPRLRPLRSSGTPGFVIRRCHRSRPNGWESARGQVLYTGYGDTADNNM